MSRRLVIVWEPCHPMGERAVLVGRPARVLGHVWPKRRDWCASNAAGRLLGAFRTQEQARRRVVEGQVLKGQPVIIRKRA